ncbi:MAG: hypothetical protein MMC33_007766 [Icmadophila ericetorum]|nr:hypothetical protein [Icmadophila ericetorum]
MVETFHNFPEPVANKIRRALYYSNIELDPKRAINYYKQALDLANDLGMDPFSAEIIGTKLQLAAFMEKIHQYEKAIQVLEIIRVDCLKWIGDGGSKPGREADRNRVLNKVVAISLRLGELYSNKHVKEDEEAERNLVLAVETMLKETKRREDEGIKEGEGQWMTNEEMGATLESLADYYSTKSQHYLSTPLYIQALSLLLPPSNSSPQTTPPTPIPSCHTITLMSNLSTSLLLQSPPSSFSPSTPSPSKAQQISSAQAWAQQAVETAKEIRGRGVRGEEGEECDRGCAVAMVNLGEMAILEGDSEGARRWFGEGKRVAKAVGWMEGVERAREGEGRVGGGNG